MPIEKPPPLSRAAILLGAVPWPCAWPLLRQFNRKAFHAAGQCYGDASHWRCIVVPGRIYLGPTGDALDRSGEKQRGHNDHVEYVTHGKLLYSLCKNRVDHAKAL